MRSSRRAAGSKSMTRMRRSPTPRSGCGRQPVGSRSGTGRSTHHRDRLAGNASPRHRRCRCVFTRISLCTTIGDDSAVTPSSAVKRCAALLQRIDEQYPHFEWRTLAVRGERLVLDSEPAVRRLRERDRLSARVREVDDDGRIIYDGRFDEDDFEGAYRELERRYYAGEGAAFAESGTSATEWMIALQPGRLRPIVRRAHRSRTCVSRTGRAQPSADRSAAEFRASVRGTEHDGRLGADMAFGRVLAVAGIVRCPL